MRVRLGHALAGNWVGAYEALLLVSRVGRLDAVHALDAALGLDAVEDDVGANVEVVLRRRLLAEETLS